MEPGERIDKVEGTLVERDGEVCVGRVTFISNIGQNYGQYGMNGNLFTDKHVGTFASVRKANQVLKVEKGKKYVAFIGFKDISKFRIVFG